MVLGSLFISAVLYPCIRVCGLCHFSDYVEKMSKVEKRGTKEEEETLKLQGPEILHHLHLMTLNYEKHS